MTGRTFGRKGQGDEAEMTRRREAFIAKERAHKESLAEQPKHNPIFDQPRTRPGKPGFQKSTGTAYMFWFFCGAVGAHRHYLGYSTSGLIQTCVWAFGWLAVVAGEIWLWAVPILGGLWVLFDAFLIPAMVREANARLRDRSAYLAFT